MNHDSHVRASLMFGRGQFQAGILVDPMPEYRFDPTDDQKLAEFRNVIWYVKVVCARSLFQNN